MPEAKTKILVHNTGQTAPILVIATRGDLTIMRETRRLVASSKAQHSPAKSARPF